MARKLVYFNEAIAKLGPSYSACNEKQSSCTRRSAQPRVGCPNCEYTIKHKMFLAETSAELGRIRRGTRAGARLWPLPKLLQLLQEVISVSYSDDRANWTVVMSQLVGVYKNEEAKKRAIDNYTPPTDLNPKGPLIPDDEGE